MTDPEVTAEIIADGVHVAVAAIQVLIGAKGFDTVLLVSDGIAATGMRDGNYRLGNFEVSVAGRGRSQCGRQARRQHAHSRSRASGIWSPRRALARRGAHGHLLPARRLGLAGKKGVIAPGADADLVASR